MRTTNKVFMTIGVFFALAFVLMLNLVVAQGSPYGANVTVTNISTAPADAAQSVLAFAGNVTEVNVWGRTSTQAWQGYFGNITGVIQLADSNNFVMYNWSELNPTGQVYVTTNNTLDWRYLTCFNFTSDGTYSDDLGQAGLTELHGTNLTQLENQYGINNTEADAVNNTFLSPAFSSYSTFYTTNLQFSTGQCYAANVFDSTGYVVGHFDEVLMYEPVSGSTVFTSIIERNRPAFNGQPSSFESMVLNNGHGTNTAPTTYYFFLEIQ